MRLWPLIIDILAPLATVVLCASSSFFPDSHTGLVQYVNFHLMNISNILSLTTKQISADEIDFDDIRDVFYE